MAAQNRLSVSTCEQRHYLVSAMGQAQPLFAASSDPGREEPGARSLRHILGVRCPDVASAILSAIDRVIQSRRAQVMRLQDSYADGPGMLLNIQPAREPDIAVVRVICLEAPPPLPSADLLSELFGLTRSETAICLALAADLSLAVIAEHRGSPQETVRGQVKVVLRKTGATSQKQLLRIITQIGASVSG